MKKILFVFNVYPAMGGLETVSGNVIDYLSSDCEIYTISMLRRPEVAGAAGIVESYQFQDPNNKDKCIEQYNEIVADRQINYVVNQGMYPVLDSIIFNADRQKNVPIYSFLHGSPGYEKDDYWMQSTNRGAKYVKRKVLCALGLNGSYRRYIDGFANSYRAACEGSEAVVMLCEPYIEEFIEKYDLGQYRSKITAIENPMSQRYSAQPPVRWSDKRNEVLFVGRLSAEKRVDIILDVWRRAALPPQWQLVIVGDGSQRAKLEKMVERQSIKNVCFVGQTTTPENYYQRAKIILLTSKFEGFPLCLIEAQRYGVLPLAFDISGGVRSIVGDGAGVIVDQDDRCAMCDSLLQLIGDDARLEELSARAYAKSDRYTIENIGVRWRELLSL